MYNFLINSDLKDPNFNFFFSIIPIQPWYTPAGRNLFQHTEEVNRQLRAQRCVGTFVPRASRERNGRMNERTPARAGPVGKQG